MSTSTAAGTVSTAFSPSAPVQRLARLRELLAEAELQAYIVPSADPHLSEYLPPRWQGRAWLSGFTGSVGTLVVTADSAGLWVDSRYWEQAEAQLDGSGIVLMRQVSGGPTPLDWLAGELAEGSMVGVDGQVVALANARLWRQTLRAKSIGLRTDVDLLDALWPERPGLPNGPVYEHEAPFATVSRTQKLARLREQMTLEGADWHFVSTLDDVCWIFNLRGADVDYNPVFLAHALIGQEDATLFVPEGKIAPALVERLARDRVWVAPYAQALPALAALGGEAALMIDPRRVTVSALDAVHSASGGGAARCVETMNPSTLTKACKTDDEIQHVREAMVEDGAALCEFFAWLEENCAAGGVTECGIDARLIELRSARAGYVSPSFGTIAAYQAHGAMPHYRANSKTDARITGDGLLLIDSGAQYVGGTTDITRVVAIGTPTEAQKRDFTVVLKGMIALSRARFPRGVRSPMLDAIARAPLWAAGIDFGHGTGHGVGYFLNVHEGPQVISYHADPQPATAMQPGMITSIEPGVYRSGQWGVRIENLVVNRQASQPGAFGEFLEFETLTLCPIDTRCIVPGLLRNDEIDWINRYHDTVRERLQPRVSAAAEQWLLTRTEPLGRAM